MQEQKLFTETMPSKSLAIPGAPTSYKKAVEHFWTYIRPSVDTQPAYMQISKAMAYAHDIWPPTDKGHRGSTIGKFYELLVGEYIRRTGKTLFAQAILNGRDHHKFDGVLYDYRFPVVISFKSSLRDDRVRDIDYEYREVREWKNRAELVLIYHDRGTVVLSKRFPPNAVTCVCTALPEFDRFLEIIERRNFADEIVPEPPLDGERMEGYR